MSHFTKIKTSLKDLEVLKKSLVDLGISWSSSLADLDQWRHNDSFASLLVRQSNGYDIGFVWNGGEYQLIADLQFWQLAWPVDVFLDKLMQRYAYNSIMKATYSKGFESVEEISEVNGSIKLTLQRWSS